MGTTRGFIEVEIVDDDLFEEVLETFTVQLIQQGTRLAEISSTDASCEASIRDDETLTAAIAANAENVAEGEAAIFTVTLAGGVTSEAVMVQFETSGTASAVDDYGTPTGTVSFKPSGTSGNTGTLEIPAGQASGTITFPILTDSVQDDGEILKVELFNVSSGGRAASVSADHSSATSTILDLDSLTVTIQVSSSVDEGASATFTIYMTKTSTEPVSVDWSTRQAGDTLSADETAEPDKDYTAETGTVAIPAGSTSATFTVSTIDDTLTEGDETFHVVLEEARNGTGTPPEMLPLGVTEAVGTIVDNDSAPTGLTIPAGEYSATANLTLTPVEDNIYEGNEQVAVRGTNSAPGLPVNGVRLTILDNDPQPTTVILTLGSDTVSEGDNLHFERITATLQGDSTLTSDVNFTVSLKGDTQRSQSYNAILFTPLCIEAGQSSGTAELWLSGTDDDVEDEDETVTIEGVADHLDLDVVPAQLIIANDDTSGVRVYPVSLTVQEGQRQRYSVSLATEPTADVVVTVDVPANAGFTVNPGTVTFTPVSWGRKFVFVEGTHDNDGDDEPAAEITHSISSTDTLYRDLTPAGVAVTIRDDDDPLVEVSFGAATYTVDEGGTVDVTLSLSVDPERPVTIPVTATEQDGASASDYSGVPVNVTFASGETQKTVTFSATQDTVDDDGETVKLGFGTLPDRVTAGTTSEATVTITDDDVPEVKVSFAAAAYPVAEGGTVDVTVTLDADPERPVIIPIKVTEQNGVSADDYSGVPAEITVNAGEMEKSFTFAAVQDDIDDDGESVMLNFDGPLPAGVTEGSVTETVLSIVDDDAVGVTISETSLDIRKGTRTPTPWCWTPNPPGM